MSRRLGEDGERAPEGMGTFGRLTSVKDLPADKVMLGYLRDATELIASGARTKSIEGRTKSAEDGTNSIEGRTTGVKPPKKEVEVPAELEAALKKNKAAAKVFAGFSPSCRREYTVWIAEAKRAETKEKRVTQAVEWIAEGKQRNWKYEVR
jgi:uncharacterized protein YdeI (YjbR/CyaY-like superfamily)